MPRNFSPQGGRRAFRARQVSIVPRQGPCLGSYVIGGPRTRLSQAYRWTLLVNGRIWGWTTTRRDARTWAEELR